MRMSRRFISTCTSLKATTKANRTHFTGYDGLYFQGVGKNIRTEDFVFETQKYNDKMIIAAPQLSDWGNTSAEQTIALTEYLPDLQQHEWTGQRGFFTGIAIDKKLSQ